ncbi:MAG: PLP-dependent aminotransferase family protein [Pseudomonadota bacterium]
MKLYEQVAQSMIERIEQGYYFDGDKLPSIRSLSQSHEVSISTAQEAYRVLEDDGWAESRFKSGYYVRKPRDTSLELPALTRPKQMPLEVGQWDDVLNLVNANSDYSVVNLGRGSPNFSASTLSPLIRVQSEINRKSPLDTLAYGNLQGHSELRKQIVRLMVDSGCRLHPDEIVTTTGCQEALSVCLRTVAQPGDVVAVDSPSFYGSMQAFKAQGLKVLEIPTHPSTGMSLEALELALEQWPVKVIQLTPTCNSPLGYTMPVENKKTLLNLAAQYDIAIIEDDIYGDLAYHSPRPPSIKSFDTDGRVLFCSSFSKTLAPGFRVGWTSPGRYLDQVLYLKYVVTACTSTLPQLAIAEFIAQGGYERHVRKMRKQYQLNRDLMTQCVERYFPGDTRITKPEGGFVLWVELKQKIDTVELNDRCLAKGVSIAPGSLFSSSGKYNSCMRLNYSFEPFERNENAVKTIGELISASN